MMMSIKIFRFFQNLLARLGFEKIKENGQGNTLSLRFLKEGQGQALSLRLKVDNVNNY